jgi:hypothetical protein
MPLNSVPTSAPFPPHPDAANPLNRHRFVSYFYLLANLKERQTLGAAMIAFSTQSICSLFALFRLSIF